MSETAVEHLKRAKKLYPQVDPDPSRVHTIPYLDELLSDDEFYEFPDALYYYVDGLQGAHGMTNEMKEHFKRLDIANYFVWQLQMFVQEFIQKELKKLGLDIRTE